jgi:hypothetical protein
MTEPKKLPYAAPELREEGNVAELTQFGGHDGGEDPLYGGEWDVEGPPGSSH